MKPTIQFNEKSRRDLSDRESARLLLNQTDSTAFRLRAVAVAAVASVRVGLVSRDQPANTFANEDAPHFASEAAFSS